MLKQIEDGSEAMRAGANAMRGCLVPAMCGCRHCGTVRMIAMPMVGACEGCGSDLAILDRSEILAGFPGPVDGSTRDAA